MALPTGTSLPFVLYEIQNLAQSMKAEAQSAIATSAAGSVNSDWIFRFLDRFYQLGLALNTWSATPGLDAYARVNIAGYSAGTLTADIATTLTAGLAVIDWIVTNFPKDSTNTYVLAYQFNADGSRTPTEFSSELTVGLRDTLTAFVATVT
jgi:hypothetical protein